MKAKLFFRIFLFCLTAIIGLAAFVFKQPAVSDFKLRTDGYYYTYDTLINSETKEMKIRFYPIIFFADKTLSDFYWQNSQADFENLIKQKKYKWIKKFSEFGDYKIVRDSIYIHEKTWSNKVFGNERGKIVDAYMKGIILNDTTFQLTENIFLGDTIKPYTYFTFIAHNFQK